MISENSARLCAGVTRNEGAAYMEKHLAELLAPTLIKKKLEPGEPTRKIRKILAS
jgi:hypothetical protein